MMGLIQLCDPLLTLSRHHCHIRRKPAAAAVCMCLTMTFRTVHGGTACLLPMYRIVLQLQAHLGYPAPHSAGFCRRCTSPNCLVSVSSTAWRL
jgi:hypothetical protein